MDQLGIDAKSFRGTFPLDDKPTHLFLSTVGYGTFMGKPDDEDDFDNYVAAKHLIRSGAVNVIDTAANFRCQKAERTMGSVIRTLTSDEFGQFTDL